MADRRRRSEERRRARLEEQRRQRARKTRRGAIAVAVVGALVVALILVLMGSSGSFTVRYVSTPSVDPSRLPGILTTPPPWPTNTHGLAARLNAEALPPLGAMEGQVLHIHQHIDIYIRGSHEVVPADIGILLGNNQVLFAPIHTHDTSGIIHVESPTQQDFALGEFFDVWGVLFTPTCLGSLCNGGNERLQVFANGKVVTGDPRRLKLVAHEEIVVTFGTPAQIPQPYPVSYRFPAGL